MNTRIGSCTAGAHEAAHGAWGSTGRRASACAGPDTDSDGGSRLGIADAAADGSAEQAAGSSADKGTDGSAYSSNKCSADSGADKDADEDANNDANKDANKSADGVANSGPGSDADAIPHGSSNFYPCTCPNCSPGGGPNRGFHSEPE